MATIADIKKRATELSGKTAPNSITPKEVGQLFYDLAGAAEDNKGDGGVPVVDIAGLDGYNLNAGVIMATGPMRFAVACDVGGPAQYSVGVCEMFSDNMMHQTTQVLTTHYTLDADGTVNRGAHTDGRLHTYWRSCKIGGDAAWGAWTPLYSYNGDGYVYRGVATPETDPTGTDTPWCRVFYLAGPGTYKNFGGLTVEPGELAALLYDGNGTSGSWRKETVPASSGSLRLDEVVDLSGITDGTKWTGDDKVNALYNIRNGSYVYRGDGDGGQAASVELTQDSSGSRLEIALLGTDGRLKVYAADISDADVTATWSVKDYDLSLLGRFPAFAQNIRSLDQADGREVTEAGVAKVLARLLYSGTVGLCTLDTSATPSPVMSTASSLKGITYYGKVKKIYANGTDGKVYEDWLSADVEPRCMSSREFLAGDDNTPLTGKVYLMNDAAGNLSLRYWTGSDMALLMDFTATLSRITDMEGKIIPKVQSYPNASGTVKIDLSYDVVVVDIGTTLDALNFSGSPVSGHRTTVYVYNGNVSDASRVSFYSDKLILYTVNGANGVWVTPNGFLRIDAVYTERSGLKELYLTLEKSKGLSNTINGVNTSSIRPYYDRVTIINPSEGYPIDFYGTPEVGHTMDIVCTAGDTTETLAFSEKADVYGVQLSSNRTFSFTNCSIHILVKFISTSQYTCIVTAPTRISKDYKVLETTSLGSYILGRYDLIYAELSESSSGLYFTTNNETPVGHKVDVYIKALETIRFSFSTVSESVLNFSTPFYIGKGRIIKLEARCVKKDLIVVTKEQSELATVTTATSLFSLPLNADFINMDNPGSETLRFTNGSNLAIGRIVYVNIHSDSGLTITFNTDWTVHGFELDRLNRGFFKGPCNILIKIWCVSNQKYLAIVLYTPLYTPEATETEQSATLSINETGTEQPVVQPAALPPAEETEGLTSG